MPDQGRYLIDREKTCPECDRPVRIPGGWFNSFEKYQAHLKQRLADHGWEFVMDHPSLVAMLDQADAAERDGQARG